MIDHENGYYHCDHCGGSLGEFNTATGNHSNCDLIAALRAENAQLRAAVELARGLNVTRVYAGFAENWEGFADSYPVGDGLTVGDLRKAAAALAALDDGAKEAG